MSTTHKTLLISTGGTIAGQVATEKSDGKEIRTADEFSELISPTVSSFKKKWDVDVSVVPHSLCTVDSSDILPTHWIQLAALIKEKYDEYDSFIITHGTNTLGYTCAALSFALANLNKPVVLTGSQVPSGMPGSDALTNLNNALRVAVWPREKNQIKGVLAVFGSHIITGVRVKKDTEFDYDAFKSFGIGSIGRIGRIIDINEQNLKKHLGYLSTNTYPEARKADDLICLSDFDMRIASLTEFPGMSPDIFQSLVEQNDIKGFVLRAFGAGDASEHIRDGFKYLQRMEIPIVVTTQAPNGNANFQVNEPGQYLKEHGLAIPAFDMNIESQITKLAWLLAQKAKKEINYSQLCSGMVRDIRGELNIKWEL
ncbi:MAG: asparaginase [Gallionellaceae bacterium]